MQRFGVPELVPGQERQPGTLSTVGNLAIDRLGLATTSNADNRNDADASPNSDADDSETGYPSISIAKRPLVLDSDDDSAYGEASTQVIQPIDENRRVRKLGMSYVSPMMR